MYFLKHFFVVLLCTYCSGKVCVQLEYDRRLWSACSDYNDTGWLEKAHCALKTQKAPDTTRTVLWRQREAQTLRALCCEDTESPRQYMHCALKTQAATDTTCTELWRHREPQTLRALCFEDVGIGDHDFCLRCKAERRKARKLKRKKPMDFLDCQWFWDVLRKQVRIYLTKETVSL